MRLSGEPLFRRPWSRNPNLWVAAIAGLVVALTDVPYTSGQSTVARTMSFVGTWLVTMLLVALIAAVIRAFLAGYRKGKPN